MIFCCLIFFILSFFKKSFSRFLIISVNNSGLFLLYIEIYKPRALCCYVFLGFVVFNGIFSAHSNPL